MKFSIKGDSLKTWNKMCEIISEASKHEAHASPGFVRIELKDGDELSVKYKSSIFCASADIYLDSENNDNGSVCIRSEMFGLFAYSTKNSMDVYSDNNQIVFKAGKSKNNISVIDDIPINDVWSEGIVDIDFKVLLSSIKKMKTLLKEDKVRNISDKINIFPRDDNKSIMFFATDGHRIHSYKVPQINLIDKNGFAIHKSSIDGMIELLSSFSDSPLQMWGISQNHMYLTVPDISVRIPILDAMQHTPEFFVNNLEKDITCHISVQKKNLEIALSRCEEAHRKKTETEKEQGIVGFIQDNSLIIGIAGSGFEMIEDIDCEIIHYSRRDGKSGKDNERFSMSIRYIRQALRDISDPVVEIKWVGVDSPPVNGGLHGAIITGQGDNSMVNLVLMIVPKGKTGEIRPS